MLQAIGGAFQTFVARLQPMQLPWHKPLVSFRINRQLSGWNLPRLRIRDFGAHCPQPDIGSV
jgi:hypothetical protein